MLKSDVKEIDLTCEEGKNVLLLAKNNAKHGVLEDNKTRVKL
jgi:hypothetical protein